MYVAMCAYINDFIFHDLPHHSTDRIQPDTFHHTSVCAEGKGEREVYNY